VKKADIAVETILETLQQFVLDNEIPDNAPSLLDEIGSAIDDAHRRGETTLEDALSQIRVVLSDRNPGIQELLPLLFTLQDALQPVTVALGSAPDGAEPTKTSLVRWDMPGDMKDLGELDEQTRFLLHGALARGLTPYLIRLVLPEGLDDTTVLVEALETSFSVVVVAVDETERRISALVVETTDPSLDAVLKQLPADKSKTWNYTVRQIAEEELDYSTTESRPWYQELPPVEIAIASSSLDRMRFLIGRLESTIGEEDRALLHELARTLEAAVSVRLRDLVEGLKPPLEDIAERQNKPVHVSFGGTAESVPAEMGEILRNALLELLINAVTHGIESSAERRAEGKPEQGLIRVFATLENNILTRRVTDDGCGIDETRVRNALKKREASGGLARVHRRIQRALGGGVTLKSGRRGSTVTITIPAATGGWNALLCYRKEKPFVVPSVLVAAVTPVRSPDLVDEPSGGRFLRFRERLLPLVEAHAGPVQIAPKFAVVLAMHTGEFALALDENPREVMVAPDGPGTVLVPDAKIERVLVAVCPVITAAKNVDAPTSSESPR
jgi:two-component sensor histidine kinase